MTQQGVSAIKDPVVTLNTSGSSNVVLICEHASHVIPASLGDLGLSPEHLTSHVAWDPGALAVAERISTQLDAPLVAGRVSRLVYDCNRPPTASDAMPERSETADIPGNRDLSQSERDARTGAIYHPFHTAVQNTLAQIQAPIIVTIHSFTRVYNGQSRAVEIGILHDDDTRLADAMLGRAKAHTTTLVQRNQPYGPEHGVTHTLQKHAIGDGHLNVMLEVRNDLIETAHQQDEMAAMLSRWIADAVAVLSAPEDVA